MVVLHPHIIQRQKSWPLGWMWTYPLWRASLGSALPQTHSQSSGAATPSLLLNEL